MPGGQSSLIAETNVSDEDMAMFYLAKQGYGSVAEVEEWDTPRFLDALEYEEIMNAIERYRIDEARRER